MGRMADYMEQHTPHFEAGAGDFHQNFGLSHKVSLSDFFGGKKIKEEELVFPIFSDYKMVSLD